MADIFGKVNNLSGLERKYTAIAKNPLNLLSGTALGFLTNGTLQKMKGRADPALSFDWYVELPTIASKKTLGYEYVESATISFPQIEEREVFTPSGVRKFPTSKVTYNDLILTFYGDINNRSIDYIQTWVALTSRYGWVGRARGVDNNLSSSGYALPINVFLKDPNGQDLYRFEYQECWPKTIDSIDLTSDSSERIKYMVTFSTNRIVVSTYNMQTIIGALSDMVTGIASAAVGKAQSFVMNQAGDLFSSI